MPDGAKLWTAFGGRPYPYQGAHTLITRSPIDRCGECGCVTRFLVVEGLQDDYGPADVAITSQTVPHSSRECAAFQALEKETWPTLFSLDSP